VPTLKHTAELSEFVVVVPVSECGLVSTEVAESTAANMLDRVVRLAA
jgi:hypothetical protein